MGQLPEYDDLETKNQKYKLSTHTTRSKIDTEADFEKWYERWITKSKKDPKNLFFRGVEEAKYKLFNSAQRVWILKDFHTKGVTYRNFFDQLLNKAKADLLLKKVFEFYQHDKDKTGLPILSLIQHYQGYTPLMDWTYNLDVALYFATEKEITIKNPSHEIDNYFSIYRINNRKSQIKSLRDLPIESLSFRELIDSLRIKEKLSPKRLVYVSDFGEYNLSLTTIFNQNIIPQQGLFIFNPSRTNPLEDFFGGGAPSIQSPNDGQLRCYNIRKELSGYIRQKIMAKGIGKTFIYPNLVDNIKEITKFTLGQYGI